METSLPLISICIPVYNGQKFIRETLDSLLAQDHPNFEVILLDNISTDDTREICLSYAGKDTRIKYILDDIQVGISEGHNRAAEYATGGFFMIACDDDVYEPSCLSKLYNAMKDEPEIGFVYSSGGLIDVNGAKTVSKTDRTLVRFNASNSKYENFLRYMFYRSPVPMIFGLYRTDIYKKALPFEHIDKKTGERNVDNIFLLKILSMTKVSGINDMLFFYRVRDRSHPPDWPASDKYLYIMKHQLRVSLAILEVVRKSGFCFSEKTRLQIWVFLNFLHFWYKKTKQITRSFRHQIAGKRKN